MYQCKLCNKIFEKRQAFAGHMSSHNRGESYKIGREINGVKRKRLESKNRTYSVCRFCLRQFEKTKIGMHTIKCEKNPDRDKNIPKTSWIKGKMHSNETKNKLSVSMKKAHMEGRAWNIGKSRWNNEKSYPEKFFTLVIQNEFDNKEYISEYPIGKYSMDFAWPKLKKAIEIDGEQHIRFEDYKKRDLEKDEFCKNQGWEILRISWKDLYKNTKQKIEEAKNFLKVD